MTYRLPSLNALRAFEAAARHLSFTVAAAELRVTSGAVSQQVKKLEQSLGIDLFRRLPHGLLLTAAGETYLPRITALFEELTDATEEIAPNINARKFTIGVSAAAARALPADWPQGTPGMDAYIRDVVRSEDVNQLRTDDLDALIRTGVGPFEDLHSTEIRLAQSRLPATSSLYLLCKPGLQHCRQITAVIANLQALS